MRGKQIAAAALGLPAGLLVVFRLDVTDSAMIAVCMISALAVSTAVVEVLFRLFSWKQGNGNGKKPR